MKPLIYQYRMQWRELLQCVGVVPDNISSMVHAFGIRLKKQEIWHPAYEAFCRCGEPYVLTMENLKGITEVQPVGTCVYIVENEMVFSYLMEQVQGKNVSLLCTSGQPRYAALKLISLIVQSGIPIYYSGDLEPDGICRQTLAAVRKQNPILWNVTRGLPEQSFKRSIWRKWQKKAGTHLAPVIKRNGGTGKENRKSGISGKYFKRAFREACRM
jgi:uncharacterized protein (TIGR02679 family)